MVAILSTMGYAALVLSHPPDSRGIPVRKLIVAYLKSKLTALWEAALRWLYRHGVIG